MRSPFAVLVAALFLAVPLSAARMSAWVPAWDPAALDAMRLHAGKLDEANPGWYTMARDGSIAKNWGAEDSNMRAALGGTDLMPTIKNMIDGRFDGAAVASIIDSASSRTAHVNAIVDLVVQQAFAGIDIDYEKVPTTSRASFTAFVRELADQLHRRNAKLSVTVHAKTSDAENWNGPGAQDWIAIGAAADSVKIMAYDYHWSTSEAGPISPLSWLDKVAAYAESTIAGGRAIMGLPWYGYDWLGTSGSGVTYAQATSTAVANNATVTHDINGEATYVYSGRTVFFQDATSYQTKVDYILSRHGGIAGFAHWRVGAEDPAIWAIVESLKLNGTTTGSSPVQPAAGDFALGGTSAITVETGSSASATVSLTPIDGFTGTATLAVRSLGGLRGNVSFSSTSLTAGFPVTASIAADRKASAGTYLVELVATSGSLEHTRVVEVTVPAPVKRRAAGR